MNFVRKANIPRYSPTILRILALFSPKHFSCYPMWILGLIFRRTLVVQSSPEENPMTFPRRGIFLNIPYLLSSDTGNSTGDLPSCLAVTVHPLKIRVLDEYWTFWLSTGWIFLVFPRRGNIPQYSPDLLLGLGRARRDKRSDTETPATTQCMHHQDCKKKLLAPKCFSRTVYGQYSQLKGIFSDILKYSPIKSLQKTDIFMSRVNDGLLPVALVHQLNIPHTNCLRSSLVLFLQQYSPG